MIPDPLHPAVVHIPIALAALLPLITLLAIVAIRTGFLPIRSWLGVLLLQAVLVGTAWYAVHTGEEQEERVEKIVAERHIESHEHAAERFMWIGAIALVASIAGLLRGTPGMLGRVSTLVLTGATLYAGYTTGHSGGELVYRHGAADAYLDAARASEDATADPFEVGQEPPASASSPTERHEDDS